MSVKRRPSRVWLDWTPEIGELFDIVAADWTPPAKAHLVRTARGSITISARFIMANGAATVARVRLRQDRHGEWFETEQRLEVRC